MRLTLADAKSMVDAMLEFASTHGIQVSIAVVDPGGLTVMVARMDNATPLSVQVAESKAMGAALWRRDGDVMEKGARANPEMFAQIDRLPLLRLPLTPADGSRVLIVGETLAGGVGVSGGPAELDRACADVGATVFAQRQA